MEWGRYKGFEPAPHHQLICRETAAWLKSYVAAPAKNSLAIYGASDYAVSADKGDYTVHVVVGVDPDGRMYLLDRLYEPPGHPNDWVAY